MFPECALYITWTCTECAPGKKGFDDGLDSVIYFKRERSAILAPPALWIPTILISGIFGPRILSDLNRADPPWDRRSSYFCSAVYGSDANPHRFHHDKLKAPDPNRTKNHWITVNIANQLHYRHPSSECALNGPECALNIHWLATERSLNCDWIFIELRLNVP
jgi:hypothetical protein